MEKPTVILYTYINRHAGTPKQGQKHNTMDLGVTHLIYDTVLGLGSGSGVWDRVQVLVNRSQE